MAQKLHLPPQPSDLTTAPASPTGPGGPAGPAGSGDRTAPAGPPWHALPVEEVVRRLGSDVEQGLSSAEAARRLEEHGPNRLQEAPGRSTWEMLFDQFKEPLVLVLIVAAVISAALGEVTDAVVILLIVVLNATLGVVQENRAEKSLAALKRLAQPQARVVRSGHVLEVSAEELVPGDLVLLEAGSTVPADCRVLEAANLKVDESALTGESVPVEKTAEPVEGEETPLADRRSMTYMGTVVGFGRGRALVVATGMLTEIGRIAELLQEVDREPTPLQRRLAQLGKSLGLAALALVVAVFVTGLLRGEPPFAMFMTAVSLAVAAIPEGLPAIVTIVLALGVQRMARRNAIIRKLPAVETLGTATVIASDKTGTLTQNEMTVVRAYVDGAAYEVTGSGYRPEGEFRRVPQVAPPAASAAGGLRGGSSATGSGLPGYGTPGYGATADGASGAGAGVRVEPTQIPALAWLLAGGALANDAHLERADSPGASLEPGWRIVGDPTEGALLTASAKAGLEAALLNRSYPRVAEVPFDSARKRMTTFHRAPQQRAGELLPPAAVAPSLEAPFLAVTKGAPDVVLALCDRMVSAGKVVPLQDAARQRLLEVNASMAAAALRVLAVALRPWRELPAEVSPEAVERDLIFLGFVGMIDPPRPEVAEAVRVSRRAGIRPIMITGDHQATAAAVAREIGILQPHQKVVPGAELDRMSDEELSRQVEEIAVYARVSPEHKMRIVDALRSRGHVVAMTGDGVNDAPALKRADIGAAMGKVGTDVAKEAADMVLADDNFATVVAAVSEGRTIFANIKKAIHYLLSCNIGEITAIFAAIVLGWGRPLTAIQILWVNLVTDGLPALALGVEPAEPGQMERPPRKSGETIFAGGLGLRVIAQGAMIGAVTLVAFVYGRVAGRSEAEARTLAFATLAFSQLVHSFNVRSPEQSLFRLGVLSNRWLGWAFLGSAALQLVVLVVPWLEGVFEVVPLTPVEWLLVAGLSLLPLPLVEAGKALRRLGAQGAAGRA